MNAQLPGDGLHVLERDYLSLAVPLDFVWGQGSLQEGPLGKIFFLGPRNPLVHCDSPTTVTQPPTAVGHAPTALSYAPTTIS